MVIAILALLVSILLPALSGAKQIAERAVCLSNLRVWGTAFHMYQSQYGGKIPIWEGAPYKNISSTWIATSVYGGGRMRGTGMLHAEGMIDSGCAYCPSEVKWALGMGGRDWWLSTTGGWHERPWKVGHTGRINMSYIYRWNANDVYWHPDLAKFPWNLNMGGGGHGWEEAYRRISNTPSEPGWITKGLLCENVMSGGRSPATPTGTAHPGGGNALYYDGHAEFLRTLVNPWNPNNGPRGYSVGYWVFRDMIDDQ